MAVLVDESYVKAQLEAYNNDRLKFYCHHVTWRGTSSGDGGVTYKSAFSFDILVPNVIKDISGLAEFMYTRNISVPCSGITKSSTDRCYSCFYAEITKSSDVAYIRTHWRHVNANENDLNIRIRSTDSSVQLSVWEV